MKCCKNNKINGKKWGIKMGDYCYRDENGNCVDYYTIVEDNTQLCKEVEKLTTEKEKYKDIINRTLNKIEELRMEKWAIMGTDIIEVMEILEEVNKNENN